jgi:hypothetical protein
MPSAIVIQVFGPPTMIKLDQWPRDVPQDFACSPRLWAWSTTSKCSHPPHHTVKVNPDRA